MRVILFGGTFDPPHKLHKAIAEIAYQRFRPDQFWFVPTFGNKYYGGESHKQPISPEHRIAMTRLIEFPGAYTSTIEYDHRLDGQTIHLLPWLPPENEYMWLMGTDQDITRWTGYEKLLDFMPFLVFPRYGFPVKQLLPGMEMVQDAPLVDYEVNSTELRDMLRRPGRISNLTHPSGRPITNFILPRVLQYIQLHGLYREQFDRNKELN